MKRNRDGSFEVHPSVMIAAITLLQIILMHYL